MKRMVTLTVVAVACLLSGCAKQSLLVRWDARLIEKMDAGEPFTFWENGTQWCKTSTMELQVYISGFVTAKYLGVAFSVENTSQNVLHFYPQECMIAQSNGDKTREIAPVRPVEVDKATRNYIAGSTFLGALNLALTGDESASRRIERDQHVVKYVNEEFKTDLSKNHTFFPGARYTGILYFPVSRSSFSTSGVITNHPFEVHLHMGENAIVMRGLVPGSEAYDGMESEEDIRQINFLE